MEQETVESQLDKQQGITQAEEEESSDEEDDIFDVHKEGLIMTLQDLISLKRKPRKNKKISVDLSSTKYDVIKKICSESFGWSRVSSSSDWNIRWQDFYISEDDLRRMLPFQKINHFPGSYNLGKKNYLGKNLTKMRQKFPVDFDFCPRTWLLPYQYEDLRAFHEKHKTKKPVFIVKPEASCQGKGIYLVKKFQTLKSDQHMVVQEYIKNPLLIDELKFDFRVYVLVKSVCPLKVFIYREGLTRFATAKYRKPAKSNLKNMCMHLTNYAVNKHSPDFQFNQDAAHDNTGHKRSFSSILKHLEDTGRDASGVFLQIRQIVNKTMCSVQPYLSHLYRSCQLREENTDMCFEVFGFDIMLDSDLKAYLIEVNHTPSFTTDTPLDYHIKHSLILDTLILVDTRSKTKSLYVEAKKQPVLGKQNVRMSTQERTTQQQKITNYEHRHQNGYFRSLPPPGDDRLNYEKYIQGAQDVHDEFTGTKRNSERQISQPSVIAAGQMKEQLPLQTSTKNITKETNGNTTPNTIPTTPSGAGSTILPQTPSSSGSTQPQSQSQSQPVGISASSLPPKIRKQSFIRRPVSGITLGQHNSTGAIQANNVGINKPTNNNTEDANSTSLINNSNSSASNSLQSSSSQSQQRPQSGKNHILKNIRQISSSRNLVRPQLQNSQSEEISQDLIMLLNATEQQQQQQDQNSQYNQQQAQQQQQQQQQQSKILYPQPSASSQSTSSISDLSSTLAFYNSQQAASSQVSQLSTPMNSTQTTKTDLSSKLESLKRELQAAKEEATRCMQDNSRDTLRIHSFRANDTNNPIQRMATMTTTTTNASSNIRPQSSQIIYSSQSQQSRPSALSVAAYSGQIILPSASAVSAPSPPLRSFILNSKQLPLNNRAKQQQYQLQQQYSDSKELLLVVSNGQNNIKIGNSQSQLQQQQPQHLQHHSSSYSNNSNYKSTEFLSISRAKIEPKGSSTVAPLQNYNNNNNTNTNNNSYIPYSHKNSPSLNNNQNQQQQQNNNSSYYSGLASTKNIVTPSSVQFTSSNTATTQENKPRDYSRNQPTSTITTAMSDSSNMNNDDIVLLKTTKRLQQAPQPLPPRPNNQISNINKNNNNNANNTTTHRSNSIGLLQSETKEFISKPKIKVESRTTTNAGSSSYAQRKGLPPIQQFRFDGGEIGVNEQQDRHSGSEEEIEDDNSESEDENSDYEED